MSQDTVERSYFLLGGLLCDNNLCNIFLSRDDYTDHIISKNPIFQDIINFIRDEYTQEHLLLSDLKFADNVANRLNIHIDDLDKSDEADTYFFCLEKAKGTWTEYDGLDPYDRVWKSELKAAVDIYIKDRLSILTKSYYAMLNKGCMGCNCDKPCKMERHCNKIKKLKVKPVEYISNWFLDNHRDLLLIRQDTRKKVTVSYDSNIDERIQRYKDQYAYREAGNETLGTPWSIPTLNAWTDGVSNGRVTAICARTGGGKTALALQECAYMFQNHNKNILYLNLEMPTDEVEARMDAGLTGTSYEHALKARWERKEQLNDFIVKLEELRDKSKAEFKVLDVAELTTLEMESIIREYYIKWGAGFIVVLDNINIMRYPTDMTRRDAADRIMWLFHKCAKEFQMHGIILAQLNRDADTERKNLSARHVRDCDSMFDHVDFAFGIVPASVKSKIVILTMKARTFIGNRLVLKNELWKMRMTETEEKPVEDSFLSSGDSLSL